MHAMPLPLDKVFDLLRQLFNGFCLILPIKLIHAKVEEGGRGSKIAMAEVASEERRHLPISNAPASPLDFDWSNAVQLIRPSR